MITNAIALFITIFLAGGILKLIIMIFTRKRGSLIVNFFSILPFALLSITSSDKSLNNPFVIVIASVGVYFIFLFFDKKLLKISFHKNDESPLPNDSTNARKSSSKNKPNYKLAFTMPTFIQAILRKQEGKRQYKQLLLDYLKDFRLDNNEKEQLKKLISEYNLSQNDLSQINEDAFNSTFSEISKNERITEQGKNNIDKLEDYFKIYIKDSPNMQRDYTRYRTLDMLDHGQLPVFKDDSSLSSINIMFKDGEILHWGTQAQAMKYKRVTQRIQFRGFSGSVRIMKGLRYRAGSYKVASQSKEFLVAEDAGIFWISNKRIGFKGQRKDFDIRLDKILSFDLTDSGLVIAKQGRENPYIFHLGYYEIPARIISCLLNK